MKVSEKTLQEIQDKAAEALQRLAQGEEGRQVAADLYCESLPDKAPAVGRMMAQHLNELVEQYEADCAAAAENQADWLDAELNKLLEGKDTASRCAALSQMVRGVAAISSAEVPEIPGEASREAEETLCGMLYDLLGQSKLDAAMLDAMAEALDAVEMPEEISASIILARDQLHDTRLVLSMTAYLNAKNGVFGDLPPSLTMDEIALGVCAAIDARQVARQVASGEISADRGTRILRAIGMVVGYMLAFLLAVFGTACLIGLLSLGQPVLTVLAFAGIYSLVWDETKGRFARFGSRVGEAAWTIVKMSVKHFRTGIERMQQALGNGEQAYPLRHEATAER